jgi:hypothetical protein
MVQNFAFFADRLGTAKIRTAKSGENVMSYMQLISVGVVSKRRRENKKPRKFLLKG